MSRFGQYCPVAASLDMLGDRWTLLIIRDLLDEPRYFNDLARGLPRLSRTLLNKRLQYLEKNNLVTKTKLENSNKVNYRLTPAGEATRPIIESLLVWGASWAFEAPDPEDLDPLLLMWWMKRRVKSDQLPEKRTVVQFDFFQRKESYWLVLLPSDTSVCLSKPKFDINLWVKADLACFFQVWLGKLTFSEALEAKTIQLYSLPQLEIAFPTWFAWSPAAEVVKALK